MTVEEIKERPQMFHLISYHAVAVSRRRWFNRTWCDNDNEGVKGEQSPFAAHIERDTPDGA